MAVPKSSLSAGIIIRSVLLEDADVSARTKKVFPIAVDNAELPYIVYRRISLESNPQKSRQPGADESQIQILCCAARYSDSVELAEAVRKALDYITAEYDGMRMRSCYLADSEEIYENDAFVQRLVFQVKM